MLKQIIFISLTSISIYLLFNVILFNNVGKTQELALNDSFIENKGISQNLSTNVNNINDLNLSTNNLSNILIGNNDIFKAIQVNTTDIHQQLLTNDSFSHFQLIGTTDENMPVYFLEKGYLVQKSVARIILPNNETATGFLISPSLFITNNHVLNSERKALNSLFEFNYQLGLDDTLQKSKIYHAEPGFFYTSPKNDLDYTVIKLKGNPGNEWNYLSLNKKNWTLTEFAPESVFGNGNGMYLQIIQHSDKGPKEVVLHDCIFTSSKLQQKYYRYSCDTEPGSSGSPVFDKYWNLFALHHSYGNFTFDPITREQKFIDNEGVSFTKIAEDFITNLENVNDTQTVHELGFEP